VIDTVCVVAPVNAAETITVVFALTLPDAGGTYCTDVPLEALSEPGPLSVHVGVAVLLATTAFSVIEAPPAAVVVAEGVTVSEAAGAGVGADGGGAGVGEPPPPPPQAVSANGSAATAA
jgi:hypothetical protein